MSKRSHPLYKYFTMHGTPENREAIVYKAYMLGKAARNAGKKKIFIFDKEAMSLLNAKEKEKARHGIMNDVYEAWFDGYGSMVEGICNL